MYDLEYAAWIKAPKISKEKCMDNEILIGNLVEVTADGVFKGVRLYVVTKEWEPKGLCCYLHWFKGCGVVDLTKMNFLRMPIDCLKVISSGYQGMIYDVETGTTTQINGSLKTIGVKNPAPKKPLYEIFPNLTKEKIETYLKVKKEMEAFDECIKILKKGGEVLRKALKPMIEYISKLWEEVGK